MQTVISAFDDYHTAQRAVERMVDAGFDRDDVHVQGMSTGASGMAGSTGSTTTAGAPECRDEDRGILSSIGHFFASLFGQDGDVRMGPAGTYAEAVKRGGSVVLVDVQTEDQADRAARLMHEMGAVDVDERAQRWRQTGWTGYEADSDTTLSGGAQPQTSTLLAGDSQHQPNTVYGSGSTQQDSLPDGNQQAGHERTMDVPQEEIQSGKRSADRGGVRVIQRVSREPMRDLIRPREGEGRTSTERERALASDRKAEDSSSVATRDRDAQGTPATSGRSGTTGRKILKKPPRNT
jgi:hypothetical protein